MGCEKIHGLGFSINLSAWDIFFCEVNPPCKRLKVMIRIKFNLLRNDFTAIYNGNSIRAREIKLKCEAKANFHFQLLLCFLDYVKNAPSWFVGQFKIHDSKFNSISLLVLVAQAMILPPTFHHRPKHFFCFLFLFGHANEHKLNFNFIFLPAMFISISRDF